MLKFISDFLVNTPWWVYALFVFLLFIGIKATRTRPVSLPRLFVVPTLLSIWGITGIVYTFGFSWAHWLLWLAGLVMIAILAYLRARRLTITVDRQNKTLLIPGTFISLLMIILIFASKYALAVDIVLHPDLEHNSTFVIIDLLVSGCATGWFTGNLIGYLQHYRHA